MSEQTDSIVNRVAKSKLVTFNLEDYYPEGKRFLLDIKDWLHEGFILREKEFRAHLERHDWATYQDAYVALYCSSEAIVPGWAYMLVATKLRPYARKTATRQSRAARDLTLQKRHRAIGSIGIRRPPRHRKRM